MNGRRALLTTEVRNEPDVVFTRQRAREISSLLGFDNQDQVRIATAVSELARNAFQYARGGRVEFAIDFEAGGRVALVIRVVDQGPGIPHLRDILDGRYESPTGMGVGLVGAKRLMDQFDIATAPGKGTAVTLVKELPTGHAVTSKILDAISSRIAQVPAREPFAELQHQNRELLDALEALRRKQEELNATNRELEDTNRGVVALYAELDQRAEELKRANAIKTRFLSNMTHEFRSPLNAVMNLTRLLLDRLDGPLTEGQEKQITLIRKSVSDLSDLVNDLLDLAKVEAGKIPVRPNAFELADAFSTLRGLFRAPSPSVQLVIEDPEGLPALHTDEGKVAQILRNLVSNALKYTERGEVRVASRRFGDREVAIVVSDTGVGIAPEHRDVIFEEFVQIEGSHQALTKGTGLGLPLSQRLATLLGGRIDLESEPGRGSRFTLVLPVRYEGPGMGDYVGAAGPSASVLASASVGAVAKPPAAGAKTVLIVDDSEQERYFMRSVLASTFDCSVIEATTGEEGVRVARHSPVALVVLDLSMPGISGFETLEQLRSIPGLERVPVAVYSAKELSADERDRLGGVQAVLSKTATGEEEILRRMRELGEQAGLRPRRA